MNGGAARVWLWADVFMPTPLFQGALILSPCEPHSGWPCSNVVWVEGCIPWHHWTGLTIYRESIEGLCGQVPTTDQLKMYQEVPGTFLFQELEIKSLETFTGIKVFEDCISTAGKNPGRLSKLACMLMYHSMHFKSAFHQSSNIIKIQFKLWL